MRGRLRPATGPKPPDLPPTKEYQGQDQYSGDFGATKGKHARFDEGHGFYYTAGFRLWLLVPGQVAAKFEGRP